MRVRLISSTCSSPMPWIPAAKVSDFDSKEIVGVPHGQLGIAVYRLDGEFFATQDVCTHQYALLSQGDIYDGCIECPIHQAMFDVRTGKAQGGVAKIDLQSYPTKIDGGTIFVLVGD